MDFVQDYIAPEAKALDLIPEGVLCGSNEIFDEN